VSVAYKYAIFDETNGSARLGRDWVRFTMLQSLLKYTIKPRGHEDAERELDEVMDLRSKYPLYLAEGENSEFKDEYDRRVFRMDQVPAFH